MKKKVFAVLTVCVLTFNLAGSALADAKRRSVNSAAIVSLLPASDGVVVVDVKRFLTDAMPKLLSGNQKMLADVTAALEDAKTKTGIDLRQFETVAAGLTAIKIKEKEYDFDTVIIASGQINAGALVATAKLGANGKYREEKVGERTIYIFAPKEIADKHIPATGKSAHVIDKAIGKEMAVTVIDTNTLAFGSLSRVRETVEGKSKVGVDITSLLNKNATSVMALAAKVPEGMSSFMPLENDELGKNIDSIKYLYGSMDVVGTTTTLQATARTLQANQAMSLKDTLEGLQMLGKAFLGNAKGADKQVYARLIENVKFTALGNEVSMNLAIAQTDIDFLVGLLAK
jgi:hypothetical protein